MTPTLHTERLVLRQVTAADTDAVVGMFAEPAMSRFLAADFTDPAEASALVARRLAYAGPPGLGHWTVLRGEQAVGTATLRPSEQLPGGVAEVSWYVARPHWRQGLGAEIVRALLRHGFGALGLPSIFALVHAENSASLRLAERTGFLDVGGVEHYGAPHRVHVALPGAVGALHHVELWVPDLARARASLGWLVEQLGWTEQNPWPHGTTWRRGATYLVVERSPDLLGERHERTRPGLNHLALHAGSRQRVDELTEAALTRGWRLLFAEEHPHAGGAEHYAAYLEDADGFEVELVAELERDVRTVVGGPAGVI